MKLINRQRTTEKRNKIKQHSDQDHNVVFETELTISRRMKVIGVAIVALMSILLGRLYYIQILSQESYSLKLASYTSRYRSVTTPRGEILDRNNNLLVTNRQVVDIVYYPAKGATVNTEWELAERFTKTFSASGDSLPSVSIKYQVSSMNVAPCSKRKSRSSMV